jgi:hypothetical protein
VAKANLTWGLHCMYSVPFWCSIFTFSIFLFYVLIMNFEIFAKTLACAENAISEPIMQLGMEEV